MGTLLKFYVPCTSFLEDPELYDWDVGHSTRLCITRKNYELEEAIFSSPAFRSTSCLVGREMCQGEIPARGLVSCLICYLSSDPDSTEEAAITAFLSQLPENHVVVVKTG